MDLKRTPTTGIIRGLITCENPAGTWTHFWGGRTVPHDDEACAACEAQRRKQWHVYLSLFDTESKAQFLFECTDFAAAPITNLWRTGRGLRGVALKAERRSAKKNAKVEITLNEGSRGRFALPVAPDIERTLQLIWRLPRLELDRPENPRFDQERWQQISTNGHGPES